MWLIINETSILYIFTFLFLKDFYPRKKKILVLLFLIFLLLTIINRYFSYVDFFILFLCFFFISYHNEYPRQIGILLFDISFSFLLVTFLTYAVYHVLQVLLVDSEISVYLYSFIYLSIIFILLCMSIYLYKRIHPLTFFSYSIQNILGYLLSFVCVTYYIFSFIHYLEIYSRTGIYDYLLILTVFFFLLSLIVSAIIIAVVGMHQKLALETERKKIEHQALTRYTEEITKQNQEIRSFRHDYLNILLAMKGYLETDDLENLKKYFVTHIQPTEKVFQSAKTRFADLQNCQCKEIGSLLSAKLLLFQDKGLKIQLEIPEKVFTSASLDVVPLIRILGIFLDNAFEEASNLADGGLSIALFPLEEDVVVVIQNKTQETLPPLYKLKQKGFSTKGDHRGLGLANVEELLKNHPQLLLETVIQNQTFTQKLTVIGGNQ